MRMNGLIPLQGQSPNPLAAYAGGMKVRQEQDEYARQVEAQNALAQYGGAALQGDQSALAQIAKYDPQGAQRLMMGQQDMRLADADFGMRREAHGMGMKVDSARLRQIEQASALDAARFASEADAATLERERQTLIGALSAAEQAAQMGPEAWDRFNDGLGEEYANAAFEDAPIILAKLRGTLGGLQPVAETPASFRALQLRAAAAGLVEGTPEYAAFMAEGDRPKTEINNNMGGEPRMGPIPAGMISIPDPTAPGNVRLVPIAGGPVAAERDAAAAAVENSAGNNAVSTDIITQAAAEARRVANSGLLPTTGTAGRVTAGLLSESNAAEVRRQVGVLKSIASLENLAALRAEGGTLGPPTDRDALLLEQATGALDANAGGPNFAAALDNYERTLLRIILGDAEGERKFQETRPPDRQGSTGSGGRRGSTGGAATYVWNPATGQLEVEE